MPQFNIPASFLIEAETREDAVGVAQALIDYGLEVSNDDGAIVAAGADTPDTAEVWTLLGDTDDGTSVRAYRTRDAAITALLDLLGDTELKRAGLTRDHARAQVESDDYIALRDGDCYWWIESHQL